MKAEQRSLVAWTRQKWRTNSGKPSLETGERYLPDAAWKSLKPGEKAATNRAKKKGMRAGEQFVPQPEKIAEKTAGKRKTSLERLRALDEWLTEFAVVVRRLPAFAPQKTLDQIYGQYASAMARRRPDGVRGEFLKEVWKEKGPVFVRRGKNFILGHSRGGTFIPTHFAPNTTVGGAKLVKELKDSAPAAFAVTPDLGKDLKRVGYKPVPKFLTDKVVGPEKEVWTNSYRAVANAAAGSDTLPAEQVKNPRFRQKPKGPKYQNKRPWRIGDFGGSTRAVA